MKKVMLSLLFVYLLASAYTSLADEPLIDEQTLSLNNINQLEIDFSHAQVTLSHNQNQPSQITMQQRVYEGERNKCLHKLVVNKEATRLQLTSTSSLTHRFFHFLTNCSVERMIKINLASNQIQQLDLTHQHGTLTADHLTYPSINMKLAHAKGQLGPINNQTFSAKLNHSQTSFTLINTQSAEIKGSHGKINIETFITPNSKTQWHHGAFTVVNSQIDNLHHISSHASTTLPNHQGNQLIMDGSHADMTINSSRMQQVNLTNQHGAILFNGSSANLVTENAHGATQLKLTSQSPFSVKAQSAHGAVNIAVPKETQFSYTADIRHGQSQNDFNNQFKNQSILSSDQNNNIQLVVAHGNSRIKML